MEFDTEIFKEDKKILVPSKEDIAAYATYITCACKMENEIPVIALIYIERLLRKTGILVNKYNWKRFLLICLCVASKVWDDDSLENIHFPKVMSDVSVYMVNKLEQIFLDLFLNYDLVIKGSEYAKYYFILHSLLDDLRNESQLPPKGDKAKTKKERKEWAEFPLKSAIPADKMANLQRNAAKAEVYLKEQYQIKMIKALGDKFQDKAQKDKVKKFDMTF